MNIKSKRDLYREIMKITHEGHRVTVNEELKIVVDGLLDAIGGQEYSDILRGDYPRPVVVESHHDVDYARINALLDLIDLID